MMVENIVKHGKFLPEFYSERGYSPKVRFDELTIGRLYNVYGICVYKNALEYLISPSYYYSLPSWYPATLFKVIDSRLPTEWYFSEYLQSYRYMIHAIWGYKELVLDETHHNNLLEREEYALTIFATAKQKIDEEMGFPECRPSKET
ncbi:hypothetical protein BegalDRAFT_1501 [Beggiatoa alba B18LD]|uniref:Uncharacterized protein n=1 Tax=Beggiatoa alba B18LD TaxID=395493 RepID=I3CFJ2_9GAMM|nr:hypothetical protein [Beggiatoa alba]EIJ42385.1 hypothetical protein BegalDRAFT_1501 [Beggiatoa alba B18LD]